MLPASDMQQSPATIGKIGFVAARWGEEILGGAERVLRGMAEELLKRGYAVEALTTCTQSMVEWTNHYPPGETLVNGVLVRRFLVDQIDIGQIHRTSAKALAGERIPYAEQMDFIRQSCNSQPLYQHLRDHQDEFACIIFAPYLFGTTYWGIQAVPEKAVLLPCLHDEPLAYFTIYRELLEQVRGVIFNAEAERRFALEKLHMVNPSQAVVGYGFDSNGPLGDAQAFRSRHKLPEKFLLYSGRLESGKNVPLLLEFFERYKNERPGPLPLVLTGTGDVLPPSRPDIVELGHVSEEDLRAAFAAATLFCQPSVNESFSIVIMEAWLQKTPVLVHADCAVTFEHVERSGGGWSFRSYEEFRDVLDQVFGDSAAPEQRGQAGHTYVAQEYNWDAVLGRLLRALGEFTQPLSLYEQLSRRGVRRALEFSRERFEERFGQVIARAEADLAQGLTHKQIDELRAAAHVSMPEYQVQSGAPVIGKLLAWLRRNLTSHLREPYIDPIIDRQEQYNKLVLDVLLPALERSQHTQQRLERQIRLLERQIDMLRADDQRELADEEPAAH